jgi:hypothetical protein
MHSPANSKADFCGAAAFGDAGRGGMRRRSTMLRNALIASPDLFLFGDANIHTDPTTPPEQIKAEAVSQGSVE